MTSSTVNPSSSGANTPVETPTTSSTLPNDDDPYSLARYITAQDADDTFNRVLATIREGRRKPKPTSAWMWFVFPQMSRCRTRTPAWGRKRKRDARDADAWPAGHALGSLDEARAYLAHPVLGPRMRAAAQAVLDSPFADRLALVDNLFHDAERLHSCFTVFRQAARYPRCLHERRHRVGGDMVFRRAIDKYFVHVPDSDEGEEDEDSVVEGEDGRLVRLPVRKRYGSRHRPTMLRLDELELEAVERRLKGEEGCVCGRTREELREMDEGSKEKIERALLLSELKEAGVRNLISPQKNSPRKKSPQKKAVGSTGGPALAGTG